MNNIPMNTDMTKAILDGRKTKTRRVIKSIKDHGVIFTDMTVKNGIVYAEHEDDLRLKKIKQPVKDFILQEAKYKKGETIWVREPARVESVLMDKERTFKMTFKYLADSDKSFESMICIPDRFINKDTNDWSIKPKWIYNKQGIPNGCIKEMARIFLKVTDVRVERLQDITIKDIFKEGFNGEISDYFISDKYHKKTLEKCFSDNQQNIITWWIDLWNSTAPKGYKREDNPYVFVYEYERVEK